MRCLTCHYSLKNLTEHRCPECGRTFDPNDPDTFLAEKKYQIKTWHMVAIVSFGAFMLVNAVLRVLHHIERGNDFLWWAGCVALDAAGIAVIIFLYVRERRR